MRNVQNLKPWPPGQSGNPAGRPRGSRNLSNRIKDYLEGKKRITYNSKRWSGEPAELIIEVMTRKAIDGDVRAATWIAKYGYGDKLDVTTYDKDFSPLVIYRPEKLPDILD